jgi:primary-amine oxidase
MAPVGDSAVAPQKSGIAPHPLDPLSPDEIEAAAEVTRAALTLGPPARFITITLKEPTKQELAEYAGAGARDRLAEVVVIDPPNRVAHEVIVSLADGAVRQAVPLGELQPAMVPEEYELCERLVREHPDFLRALEVRGLQDLDLICVDPIPFGGHLDDPAGGRRLVRALVWKRPYPGGNPYAQPVEGIVGVVDLYAEQVVSIVDSGQVPLPNEDGEYRRGRTGPERTHLRPIEIVQPEGPSFEVSGNQVCWQRWSFRVGFTAREGLVLHQLGYEDKERVRPILHRASFSEMSVPYGDPSPNRYIQSPFDIGENLVGTLANPLELGCDCLGVIHYFDAHVADSRGKAVRIPNAICMHEEDYGILWKHTDFRTGDVEVRRSRRLVVSSISTIGNYEYGFFWYLYLDGTIECEVKATGIISTAAVAPGETPRYGTLVAPGVNGMIHQHFFNVRLDLDVDGTRNSVYEVNTASDPTGETNPFGNAFYSTRRLLQRESDAPQVVDPLSDRYWLIVNPESNNAMGQPVAFKLIPGANVRSYAQPGSNTARRAGFCEKHVWVTQYEPSELYAAGPYPNQHQGGAGLPEYAAQDRPLENEDVVLWYTFGLHHLPRPEDWPVMPVAYIGFMLKPFGFFDRNPAMDVPPPQTAHDHCHHHHAGSPDRGPSA